MAERTSPPVRLGLALLVSVLAGLLVAGLAVPVVGGAGLAAKAAADDFLAMPEALQTPRLATRSRVLAADGSTLATFYRVNRITVPWQQIPEVMRQAQIAIEDSRFYDHHGVDYKGTLRAAATNFRSGRVAQGGSTITQQYVKNALIEAARGDKRKENAARVASAERKLREARYALALERRLDKDEILHRYLQVTYYGNRVYGVATAAEHYFGVPVQELTLGQAAVLAGVVQNPGRYNLSSTKKKVRADIVARRDTVLKRMADEGFITERARARAASAPLRRTTSQTVGANCADRGVKAPFFCRYLQQELEQTDRGAALGRTPEERSERLFTGGLTIRTTLDPKVQRAAQRAVDRKVPNGDPSGVAAVADVVEPGTGAVKAMAVNRPFGAGKGETQVNLATGGSLGFQPGSTFKVFWLVEALRQGMELDEKIFSPSEYVPTKFKYEDRPGQARPVNNAEVDESGSFDLRTGTHASVNTFYMQVAERVGLDKPLDLAEQLGLRRFDGKPLARIPSSVLGSQEVSPLAMAAAYATFAASGTYCAPYAVEKITDSTGREVDLPEPDCGRAIDKRTADTVTAVLSGVVDGRNPLRTGRGAKIDRPVAGKTGTTTGSTAAWFVGYTPQLSTAVWVGNPAKASMTMRRITINGKYYRQVYGGTLPASIFASAMRDAHRGLPEKQFDTPSGYDEPDGSDLRAATRAEPEDEEDLSDAVAAFFGGSRVPSVRGRSYASAAAELRAAGFAPVQGRTVRSGLPSGDVPYTFPRAGSSAAPGTTVYVYRSTGR
ncbi:MAG: transglycosylase domain-containing protein [Actinomycetota bacterium]|nr:transglycosylase domain-containing protein [Actinomycetota bacterium]